MVGVCDILYEEVIVDFTLPSNELMPLSILIDEGELILEDLEFHLLNENYFDEVLILIHENNPDGDLEYLVRTDKDYIKIKIQELYGVLQKIS